MEQKATPIEEIGMTDFNLFGIQIFVPRGTKIKIANGFLIFHDLDTKMEFIKIQIPANKIAEIKGKNISLKPKTTYSEINL